MEVGAQGIQYLKRLGNVDTPVAIGFISYWCRSRCSLPGELANAEDAKKIRPPTKERVKKDVTAFAGISQRVHRFHLPPMISLPVSGIERVSLWVILAVAFVGGAFSGFLGGGAGYIRMPSLVFLLGVPTHVAVGTDLFEIMISASYGTFSHALKGNVDVLVALVMHTGAAIGAQIGATLTEHFEGPRIRMAFIPLPLIGAGLVVYTLMTGHKF